MRDFNKHSRACPGRPAAFAILSLVLATGLGAGSAAADEQDGGPSKSIFDQKYTLALGGFFPAINSTFSLNSSDGSSGGDIDLQDDLGFDDGVPSFWAAFTWRFQPRHQLQVEWFQLNQDGNTTAARDLPPIGDSVISVGAGLSSKLDFNLGRVTYGYSILRDQKYDLSFLVGAHIATAKMTVTGSGMISVDGGPVFQQTVTESTSTYTFPLPHIGGQFTYKFAPRWATQFSIMAFALELGDYSGTLLEVDGRVAYQLSKHFGIGGGLKYFNLNVQAQKISGGAEFDYEFLGPTIFGYASF